MDIAKGEYDMYDYETSEQLFLDIWEKYGSPDEVEDTGIIYNILNDLCILQPQSVTKCNAKM